MFILLLLCGRGVSAAKPAGNAESKKLTVKTEETAVKTKKTAGETDGAAAKTEETNETDTEAGNKEKNLTRSYEVSWEKDVTLKGLFDSTSLYVQAGKWKVKEALLELHMGASQLLNTDVSYISINLDGVPVETLQFSEKKEGRSTFAISLPTEILSREGGHSVSVEAYLRGQTTDACVDDSSVSAWLNLFSDSKVKLEYEPLLVCDDIAGFYEKFVSLEALEEEESMAVTGKGASDEALTALVRILSGFGNTAAGNCENIRTGIIEKEQDMKQAGYFLYVDRFDNLPEFIIKQMTEQQKQYAQSSAVICLQDYGAANVLLVTGNQEKALKNAGCLLSNPELISSLTGVREKSIEGEDYRTASYERGEYIPLTQYGAQVKGSFEQSLVFTVDSPAGKKLADSAQISLDFGYSANIDFDKSLLTVYINEIPVGSRALTEEGADRTEEIFDIPKDIDTEGTFTVETQFMLYPKGDWCELTPEEIPWAYVAESSMLKWPLTDSEDIFFEYYPFPFVRSGEFSELKILLPKKWNETDFNTMTGIMLTMGKWLKSNGGEMEVLSILQTEDFSNANIISIGNTAVNQLNIEKMQVKEGWGSAALAVSPYADTLHAVLTVSGKDDQGMKNSLAFLGRSSELWKVKGDLFHTDGKEINCQYIEKPKKAAPPPELKEPEIGGGNIPVIVICSMLILILLSAAMLLIKYSKM